MYSSPPEATANRYNPLSARWGRTETDRTDEPEGVRFVEFIRGCDVHSLVSPASAACRLRIGRWKSATIPFLANGAAPEIGVIGFASDEGVRRNSGRPGAREGPLFFRKKFGKLAIPERLVELLAQGVVELIDCGDVMCEGEELESAQAKLGEVVATVVANGMFPIVIGGGHEVAWGHYQGLRKAYGERNFGVLNFDAHFDLRDLPENGKGHSGTPFLEIAVDIENKIKQGIMKETSKFMYTCLGVQDYANTKRLFETARKYDVRFLHGTKMMGDAINAMTCVQDALDEAEGLYATFCLDVLSAAEAPGVSAPQPFGLKVSDVIPLLEEVASSPKTIAFDVAELCPRLDVDSRTIGVASYLVAHFVTHIALARTK